MLVDCLTRLMPVATPLTKTFRHSSPEHAVGEFRPLATTLAQLHAREIYHRDIKPANLLRLEGRLCLSEPDRKLG